MDIIIHDYNTKETAIRHDLERICGDLVEAIILDKLEQSARQSPEYQGDEKIVWIQKTGEIIQKEIGFTSVSVRTIQNKLNSLITKKLLLAKRDDSSRSPKAKYYAINTPLISEKLKRLGSTSN